MINTIYVLKNKINKKIYVGQTWLLLENRWNNGYGYLGCTKLNNAIKKIGKNNFYYEILMFCFTQEVADFWEIEFIKKFNSIQNGYNIASGGKSVMFGRKHSLKSILKMSNSHKGNTAHLGKTHTEETKKKLSDITKKQIEENGHPFLGKKHSEESKIKMSIASTGQAPNSGSFKLGESDERHKNRMGKTWKIVNGKRVWSDKK